MSAADLLRDLVRDETRADQIERLWQDFLHTHREICDLREQLARKEGHLNDLSQELHDLRKDIRQDLQRASVS